MSSPVGDCYYYQLFECKKGSHCQYWHRPLDPSICRYFLFEWSKCFQQNNPRQCGKKHVGSHNLPPPSQAEIDRVKRVRGDFKGETSKGDDAASRRSAQPLGCLDCEVRVGAPWELEEHLNSRDHEKVMKLVRLGGMKPRGVSNNLFQWCVQCNILLTPSDSRERHNEGNFHKAMVGSLEEVRRATASGKKTLDCFQCRIANVPSHEMKCHLYSRKHFDCLQAFLAYQERNRGGGGPPSASQAYKPIASSETRDGVTYKEASTRNGGQGQVNSVEQGIKTNSGDGKFQIVVRNLTKSVKFEAIHSKFEMFGEIVQTRVLRNAPLPYAIVEFKSKAEADFAIEVLNNTEFEGKVIEVRWKWKKFVCEFCDVACNSPIQLEEHVKKCGWAAAQFKSKGVPSPPKTSQYSTNRNAMKESPNVSVEPAKPKLDISDYSKPNSSFTQADDKALYHQEVFESEDSDEEENDSDDNSEDEHCQVGNSSLACEFCGIISNSASQLNQHSQQCVQLKIKSSEITAKEVSAKKGPNSSFPCELCGIICNSTFQLDDHFKKCDKQKRNSVKRAEELNRMYVENLSKIKQENTNKEFNSVNSDNLEKFIPKLKGSGDCEQIKNSSQVQTEGKVMSQQPKDFNKELNKHCRVENKDFEKEKFTKSSFPCEFCGVICNSVYQLDHHSKKCTKRKESSDQTVGEFHCVPCNVSCPSAGHLNEHYGSKKHLAKCPIEQIEKNIKRKDSNVKQAKTEERLNEKGKSRVTQIQTSIKPPQKILQSPENTEEVRQYWQAGNKEIKKEKFGKAIQLFSSALSLMTSGSYKSPSLTDIYECRSHAYFMENQHREALEDGLNVIKKSHDNVKVLCRIVRSCIILGETQIGKDTLAKIPEGKGDAKEQKSFADKLQRLENLELSCVRLYEKKDYRKVLDLTEEALKLSPKNLFFITIKAKCLAYLQRSDEALQLLESQKNDANIQFVKGLLYYSKDKLKLAASQFEEAKNSIPEAASWLDRIQLLLKAKLTPKDIQLYGGGDVFNQTKNLIPLVLINRATFKINKEDFKGALEDADQVLETVPGHTEAITTKVKCHLAMGDVKKAELAEKLILDKEIKKLYADKLQKVEDERMMALDLMKQGQFAGANDVLKSACKTSPKSETLLLMHAECLAMLGKVDEASKKLNSRNSTKKDKSSTNADVLFVQGLCFFYKNNFSAAVTKFTEAISAHPEGNKLENRKAATWLERVNSVKKAQLSAMDVKEFGGEDVFKTKVNIIPVIFNNRAEFKIGKEDFNGALEDATKTLSIIPGHTEAVAKVVQCHLALGNMKDAESSLKSVKDEKVKKSFLDKITKVKDQHMLALDLMNQGQYSEAIKLLNSECKIYPKNQTLGLTQAECLIMMGKVGDACKKLPSLTKFGHGLSKDSNFLFIQGLSFYYKNNLSIATTNFKEAKSLASSNKVSIKAAKFLERSESMNNALRDVSVEKRRGNKLKAVEIYSTALTIDPGNKAFMLQTYLSRAELHRDIGNYIAAVGDYESAIEIDKENYTAWLEKGKIHLENDSLEEAVSDLEKAYEISETQEARASLKAARKMLRQEGKQNHYNVLGVGRNAKQDEIKKAYHKKAKEFHPDKHSNASDDERLKMESRMKEITVAQQCLSDPAQKRKYDLKLDREDEDSEWEDEESDDEEYSYGYGFSVFEFFMQDIFQDMMRGRMNGCGCGSGGQQRFRNGRR